MMLRRKRQVPPTPPSLATFARKAVSVTIGWSTMAPSNPQVPRLRNASPGLPPVAIMAEAVSCSAMATAAIRGTPSSCAIESRSMPPGDPGGNDRGEHVGWQSDLLHQRDIPVACVDREALRGGGDGVLVLLFPGQEEAQQVGRHQQGLGAFQQPGALVLQADELVERVERQTLDAGAAVELGGRNAPAQLGLHGAAAHIAIVVGVAQELVGGVEQPVIQPPGVDAEGGQRVVRLMRGDADGMLDLTQQAQDIPVDSVADARGRVRKAMHLANLERRHRASVPSMARPLVAPRSMARWLKLSQSPVRVADRASAACRSITRRDLTWQMFYSRALVQLLPRLRDIRE